MSGGPIICLGCVIRGQTPHFDYIAGEAARGIGSIGAETGVPTAAQLARGFSEVARAVVAAGAGDEADGLLSGVLRRLGEVITVRPVGNVTGSGAGAVVARAEYRLAGGDLTGAITELDGLAGPAAEAAVAWRAEADARLAADAAFADFAGKAVARFASGGG